jgi:hypothetical protein
MVVSRGTASTKKTLCLFIRDAIIAVFTASNALSAAFMVVSSSGSFEKLEQSLYQLGMFCLEGLRCRRGLWNVW